MRGITTPVTKIRRQVFTEIARLAYEDGDYSRIEELPYTIIPGEVANYRDSVFKERAIVGERLRLAVGLPLRPVDQHAPVSQGMNDSAIADMFYEPPLINVISFACNACEETSYTVSNLCRNCLAHPCTVVCPVKAVSIVNGRSQIDKTKCVKCGRCAQACPYSAIVKSERPCAAACGVNAIDSCGQCLVSCPFSAIADKSQIFQLIQAIKRGDQVIAEVAPAFVGQFGPLASPEKVRAALRKVGFAHIYEVARGADIGAVEEAEEFIANVPTGKKPFLATSCCYSWIMMAQNMFPEIAHCISDSMTPMVATARIIKEKHPNARVVFIGPCASKKLEAMRADIRSDVDFVITFEELMGHLPGQRNRVLRPAGRHRLQPRRHGLRTRLRRSGRCGQGDHRLHRPDGAGAGRDPDRPRGGTGRLPQDADAGQGGQAQRIPAGGHGLPGRLRRRRRHADQHPEGRQGRAGLCRRRTLPPRASLRSPPRTRPSLKSWANTQRNSPGALPPTYPKR